MKSGLVSVLIPSYNRAHLISDTLDSILAQRLIPSEIIVVDDGSTDNTSSVLSRYGDRIRYTRVTNGRACRARNIAASLAHGEFFAFCDSDDLWHQDKLAEQMDLHFSYPQLRYSFTNFQLLTGKGLSAGTKFDDIPAGLFTPSFTEGIDPFVHSGPLLEEIIKFQPIFPSTVVVHRDLFQEIGGFDERFGLNPSEDLEFTMRCVRRGPIGVLRRALVHIRKHEANFSADQEKGTAGEIEILEHSLQHHGLPSSTRAVVRDQIAVRRVELSYGAFRRGEFERCAELLSKVPRRLLSRRSRLKLLISRLPAGVASPLRRLAVQG